MRTNEIKSLLTKFYYNNEHLYFQILVQKENSMEVYGEYADYRDYKKNFDMLQKEIDEKMNVKIVTEKIIKTKIPLAKVA